MSKKIVNEMLTIFVLFSLIVSSLQIVFLSNTVDATQSTIDASAGITTATQTCMNRKIVRGQDGTLYSVYQRLATVNNIFFANSTDEGVTWSTPKQLTFDTAITTREDPALCIDSTDTLHVAYFVSTGTNNYLNYTYSTDKGNTWSTPVNISGGLASTTHSPTLAVNSLDTLYCFWSGRYAGGPAVTGILYRTCNPTTHVWSSLTPLVVDGTSQEPSVCMDSSNNVHLSFSGYHAGSPAIYQIRYKKYTYATSTWGTTINVTNTATAGRHSGYSSIVVNSTGIVHIFWEGRNDTHPHGANKQIFHISYNGATWSAKDNLTDCASDVNYPSATLTADDELYVVYYWISPGLTRNIYYNYKTVAGSWSSMTAIISDATEDRYPNIMYANYPYISGLRTNRPKTGFALIWTADTTVKYFASPDLTWDGSVVVNSSISVIIRPDGDSSPQDFEVLYGATHDWDAVDDLICDFNSTYISATFLPPIYEYDIFTFEDVTLLPSMLSISNVTLYTWMRKTDASTISGDLIFFSGVMGYNKGPFALTPSFQLYSWKMSTNPHTGVAWTWSDVQGFTAGVCARGPASCSMVYAVVNYSSIGYMVPTISFASDSSASGPQTLTKYINANLTSVSGSNGTHYVLLEMNDDVVLWERFEQVTPYDSSNWSNAGTIIGSASQNSSYATYGKSYNFPGTSAYVRYAQSTALNNTDETLTISMWAKATEDYSSFPASNRGLGGFYHDSSNRIYCAISNTGQVEVVNRLTGNVNMLLSPILPAGFIQSWHHYAFAFTSTNITLYIDGVYQGVSNFTGSAPNLNSLIDGFYTYIGRGSSSGGNYDWKGGLDEFIVIDRSLNLSEVKALYDANVTQYKRNFTNLPNGNYTFKGTAVNSRGYMDSTEVRWTSIDFLEATTISLVLPTPNGTTTADLWPTCQVRIDDTNPSDVIHATWQENSTGVWVTRKNEAGISPGDTISWTYTQAQNLSTKYWFRVWANDTTFNTSAIFCFTTATSYSLIKGLTNGSVDWDGLPGTNNWCNDSGTYHETMEINITVPLSDTVTNISVYAGDLSLVYPKSLVNGWNHNVSFPDWIINDCASDSPEDVFSSALIYIHDIDGFDALGNHLYWNYTGFFIKEGENTSNTLLHILPLYNYNVFTTQACTVQILSSSLLTASNLSIQFSSDNITWGTDTRTFLDGGNDITINSLLWSNANGCYGSNPFIPILSGRRQSIYCRFKLNIPLVMPSDESYLSLSSDNWKVYINSNMIVNDTLPATYAPSLPAGSNDLLLKWSKTLLEIQVAGRAPPVTSDVNGDGRQEIFWAGLPIRDVASQYGVTVCINSTTGTVIWKRTWDTGWGPTNTQPHFPLFVYDVNKDGRKEVVQTAGGMTHCYDAQTGIDVWNVSVSSGWHNQGYIDYGNEVAVYIVGTGYIKKLDGATGTVLKTMLQYYTCWGGISVADINEDGRYEILCGGRNNGYGGGTYGGMRVYDDDLNLLWSKDYILCSTQCPVIADYNGDGRLEVIVGHQGDANSKLYIFDGNGTTLYTSPTGLMAFHVQPTYADIDYDGNLEVMEGDDTVPVAFDLITHTVDHTFSGIGIAFHPSDVGNIIRDPGPLDNNMEIITTTTTWGSESRVYKYNLTTHNYDLKYTFPAKNENTITQDLDHDGYNELLLEGPYGMSIYETKVPAPTPRVLTNIAFNGLRRLNDNLYDAPPCYDNPFSAVLSFGGDCYVTTLSPTLFISGVTSSKPLVEYNGFYNKGDYTTWINATLYMPTGWTLDKIYFRMRNGTTLYENITTGFIATNVNSTYKSYCKLYNPSTIMNGKFNCNVDVYVESSYNGMPLFSGSKTFNNTFVLYHIESPYNGSSSYNTTLQSVNMTWDAGNYTDRYIVVRKNGIIYPTTPTDGTVVQNSTSTAYNEASVFTSRSYSVFGYNATSRSYSDPLNIPWGAVGTNCYNESNPSQSLTFDLEVTNQPGTIVYKRTGLTNTHYIDVQDIPYGINTIFIVESSGYKQRIYYKDITLNTFYNYSFYLPPDVTQGGGGGNGSDTTGCTLRLITNSINVSSYTSDVIVPLTHEVEDMVAVEIYNRSLYISYGGWIMIPETKFTVSTTQVTIDKSVLDANTSMARVSYYYMYCPGDVITTPLYYIRVVETVETEYSTYDRGVEGVKVDIKRYVNTTGIYVSVAQLLTDANGYCNVYLIPGTLYKVLVSKLLYYDALSDYIPAPANQFGQTTEKIFRISLNETTVAPGDVDYLFKNIVWSIEPTGIRHPGAFTMWFNITSSDSKLEWYSMEIFYWNTTTYSWVSIFYQNDSNAGGGSISFTIPNVTGKYAVKCYFKKTGFPVQELGETGSLIHFIQYFQQWMHGIPDYAYYIVLLFIMVVAMGFFFLYFGTGISTGYIGIIIFAIGLFIHPVTINGISGWIIFAITFIMYTIGIFLWSRI